MNNGILIKMSQLALLAVVLAGSNAMASMVTLQFPTATASQSGLDVSQTIDTITTTSNGWAINPSTSANTAVWETASDVVGGPGGSSFTFTIIQAGYMGGGSYTLGHFRLSVTTDDRSTFADGLANGGDVTADWTQLTPLTASDAGSGTETFTINGDNTISVTGDNPVTATYIVTANTTLNNITGIRLEALKYTNPAEADGPGRTTFMNSNFIVTEFEVSAVDIVPEPASAALLIPGILLLAKRRRA